MSVKNSNVAPARARWKRVQSVENDPAALVTPLYCNAMNITTGRMAAAITASTYSLHYALTPQDWHFIDSADLIFHEAGHALFFFLGDIVHVAMGSGFQILLPFSIVTYFIAQRQALSSAISLMWTGMNLINVSIYAGDAIAMQLPLLGGDSVIHDWNYLLTQMNILKWTPQIATALFTLGVIAIGLGAVFSFWFAVNQISQRTVNP